MNSRIALFTEISYNAHMPADTENEQRTVALPADPDSRNSDEFRLGIFSWASEHRRWRFITEEIRRSEQDPGFDDPTISGAIVPCNNERLIARLSTRCLPILLVDPFPEDFPTNPLLKRLSAVRLDSRAVGVRAAEYFLLRKYRHFAYVAETTGCSWSHERRDGFVERLRAELDRLRGMGFEVIPKLNFSACHDEWLGEWGRMLSTPDYYRVCEDLIRDVAEIFDRPEFLHIGMDEELPMYQPPDTYEMCVVRRGELWWHDFLYLVKECEAAGMRAWAWSDYAWWHPHAFVTRCPKSVLLSDWCYCTNFDLAHEVKDGRWALRNFVDFDNAGFEQVPTGSNYNPHVAKNFGALVDFCDAHIAPERLRGYLQTPWAVMIPRYRDRVLEAVDIAAAKFAERGDLPSAAQRRYSAAENAKLVLPADAEKTISERKAKDPGFFAPWSPKAW